jgi:hypothetical protein
LAGGESACSAANRQAEPEKVTLATPDAGHTTLPVPSSGLFSGGNADELQSLPLSGVAQKKVYIDDIS